jgi:L-ascorbate metabolism protein UlaG (beta-lactamase superfamily)
VRITALGHASVLVEAAGRRVLVDPIFADHIASGSVGWMPPRRVDPAALGPVDAVVLTHGHLDHFHGASVATVARNTGALLVVPDDDWLLDECRRLALGETTILRPWDRLEIGGLELVATPSSFPVPELGLLFGGDGVRYWHMSDTIVDRGVGEELRAGGRVDVVAARYQPGNVLAGYQRNLGASHDEREAVVELLEAACAVEPRLVFPYFWGVTYLGEHAWANRWTAPFTAVEIAGLLERRLGPGRAAVVEPGDVVTVDGGVDRAVDRGPSVARQAAPFVATVPGPPPMAWEPVDLSTLPGVPAADRAELARRFEAWFASTAGPWLRLALGHPGSPVQRFVEWGVVWQVVVHAGDGERLVYSADFRADPPTFAAAPHPLANYVVHLSGSALWQVLTGRAGSELFWMSGAARFHEKILRVDGRFEVPPARGFELWEQLPEPVTLCLRKLGVDAVRAPSP